MNKGVQSLTAQRLREVLDYDRDTGVFTWRVTRTFTALVGTVAGRVNPRGYVSIKIDGVTHLAHRLAWLHVHGSWPTATVDHRDTDKTNNRFLNLRDVVQRVNGENLRVANRDSKTGLLGVCFNKKAGKYQAAIKSHGRTRHLGLHATPELAHQAYLNAKRQVHEGNTL